MPGYVPQTPPAGLFNDQQATWLREELGRMFGSMQLVTSLRFDTLTVAPAKPRDGDVVLADGTNWNPGSGPGWYGYRAGAWRFLG